ncbi:hypothetical protein AX16_000157 [Volvariella volvacea WC 439]|nr:hypothetical protein AX16_000157 [Volvariella volvacea WC 439]
MRAHHTQHSLPTFPVYSSAFLSPSSLVLGGGGGASRSGIKNKLRLYNIADDRSIELVDEFELAQGEDAPMSMAGHSETSTFVCGINSVEDEVMKGRNKNCRVFGASDKKLTLLEAQGTLTPDDPEDYQKVTVISQDGSLVAVAGAHDLSLLNFPSLELAAQKINTEKEIYDAAFSDGVLVIATTANLLVYALSALNAVGERKGESEKETALPALELVKTVTPPTIAGTHTGSTFRSVRYHPTNQGVAYTTVNTTPPRTRTKSAPRHGYICKWDTKSWTVEKTRKISDKALTCFDVSPDGRLLGFGSSDLSIGLLDANTLAPFVTILKAHELPPTLVKFNPPSTLLISGSADNSIRVVTVPLHQGTATWGITMLLLITLVILLVAFLVEHYLRTGTIGW